jgi:hypothetical protein
MDKVEQFLGAQPLGSNGLKFHLFILVVFDKCKNDMPIA